MTDYRQILQQSIRFEKNQPFLELMVEIVRELLLEMKPNVPFVLSELCEDYWGIPSDYEKRLTGMFISQLVSQNLLPMKTLGKRGSVLVYQLVA